jgi:hypothetical protein
MSLAEMDQSMINMLPEELTTDQVAVLLLAIEKKRD